MAKKEKKQNNEVVSLKAVNYALLVPDSTLLSDQDVALIQKSNAKAIFVLNHNQEEIIGVDVIELQSMSYEKLSTLLKEKEIESILYLGNDKCNTLGITEVKKKSNSIKLVGARSTTSKEAKGKLSRVFFELSTQLFTSIQAYGSHTKTAIIPSNIFLGLMEKYGVVIFQDFKTMCSRSVDNEYPLTSVGSYDQISVSGVFKTIFQNIGFYFKEKISFRNAGE